MRRSTENFNVRHSYGAIYLTIGWTIGFNDQGLIVKRIDFGAETKGFNDEQRSVQRIIIETSQDNTPDIDKEEDGC